MRNLPGVLLLLLLSVPLAAQTTNVTGRVTLPDGSALPGVTVTADELGVTAVTDANGRYTLAVPSNRAQVKISAALQGFQTRTAMVDVGRGETTHDFVM